MESVTHRQPGAVRRRVASGRIAACLAVAVALTPLATSPVAAAPVPEPRAVSSATDATPDRVVLTPPQNPDTAQSFTWRTGAEVTEGAVHLRAVGTEAWRVVAARANEVLTKNSIATRTHSVTVDGLTPKTRYEYFVGNDAASSSTYTFTTAGEAGDPFTFIYFGDAQNDLAAKWTPVVDQAFEKYPDAVGTVNAGDLINTGNDTEWTEWFDAMDGHSQTANVIAAPGNHEYSADEFLKVWKSTFEYAANGPAAPSGTGTTDAERQKLAYETQMATALAETAYFTDYQGVRFISLNASTTQADALMTPANLPSCLIGCPNPRKLWLDVQARWLDFVLQDNPNKWAVAVFHQPVYSTAVGRDEVDIRNAWQPVFQSNDIDLVLMGHDHTYARGYANTDATTQEGITTGPVYAVSVSGPKYYEQQPADNNVWTQNDATQVVRAGHTSTFQGIRVTDDQLRYESIVAAKWDDESTTTKEVGETLDAFTITKYDDGTKWVTEDGVAIPAEGETGPGDGTDPGSTPDTDEEPAGTPATAALGHQVIGTVDASTAAAPGASAIDPAGQMLYVADQTDGGVGRVEAIDLTTDEVVNSFDVGGPVSDITYSESLAAVLVASGSALRVFSTNPGTFGEPITDAVPMPYPVRGVGVDELSGIVYAAVQVNSSVGAILAIDAEEGSIVGQTLLEASVKRMRVDAATGNVYVTLDRGADGTVGLRVYAGRSKMAVLKQYPLDAGARSLDLDPTQGLVYVGHAGTVGGLSVVDILHDTVTRLTPGDDAEDAYPVQVQGVATDPDRGVAYVTSSTGDPAEITIVARTQAPRILTSPIARRADAGTTVTFSASAFAVPAPTVSWESRAAGAAGWVPVSGARDAELAVVASEAVSGTQYRAVFANVVAGTAYSTRSASATLLVNAAEVPEEPEDPTIRLSVASGSLAPGQTVTITGSGFDAEAQVQAWFLSTPTRVGSATTDSAGGLRLAFTVPETAPAGAHHVQVRAADGTVLASMPVTVVIAAVAADPDEIASTGANIVPALLVALLALGCGAAFFFVSRRRMIELP